MLLDDLDSAIGVVVLGNVRKMRELARVEKYHRKVERNGVWEEVVLMWID